MRLGKVHIGFLEDTLYHHDKLAVFSNPKVTIQFPYSVHKLNDQNKSVSSHKCRKHYQQNDVGNPMLHGCMFECISVSVIEFYCLQFTAYL